MKLLKKSIYAVSFCILLFLINLAKSHFAIIKEAQHSPQTNSVTFALSQNENSIKVLSKKELEKMKKEEKLTLIYSD